MLIARFQVSQRRDRDAVIANLAGFSGRKGGPRVQEVAATLCRLMTVKHLAKHFKTWLSPRNRYRKIPRGVSETELLKVEFAAFHI